MRKLYVFDFFSKKLAFDMFEPLSVRNMNKTKQLKIKLEIKKFKNNLLAKKFFRRYFLQVDKFLSIFLI